MKSHFEAKAKVKRKKINKYRTNVFKTKKVPIANEVQLYEHLSYADTDLANIKIDLTNLKVVNR